MFHFRTPFLFAAAAAVLCAQETVTVQGHVFSTDGSRLGGATVTISGKPSTYVGVTESGADPGRYVLPGIPSGTYDITAGKTDYRSQTRNVPLSGGQQQIDFVLDPACASCASGYAQAWWTLLVVLMFLASIWLVRWHNIARPNRELLKTEVENARARFRNETGINLETDPTVSYLKDLLDSAKTSWSWGDFFFWTRGQEITGWSRIHEFQRGTVKLFAEGSLETIRARLQSVELDLLDSDKTHAKTLAGNIKDALDTDKTVADELALRALLVEALTYLNDEIDNEFAQLVGWQTKAVWLAGVGCTLLVVLGFAAGNSVLFIAGATGGYLSRLARSLKRADVPTDYGASWTTLFLSPIVGALSGWFGILLLAVLSKFQVLGEAFRSIQWNCPLAPFTLGLAFAFGFSERLFDGIISSLEDKVDSDRKAATQPQQPTSKVDMTAPASDEPERDEKKPQSDKQP